MTTEEITRILQTVAQNQARADEEFAMLLKSHNRYEERLATISDIMHDLADKQIKNEERFAETDKRFAQLADAQMRHEARMAQLEANYELFEGFVRDFRNETNQRLDGHDEANVQTESRLDALIDTQIQLTHRVDALTADISVVNGRAAATDDRLDRMAGMVEALVSAQARTDEQIRSLLDRNGSTLKAKKKPAKKAGKKRSAK
jgi:chromosome segregation ATPase